MDKKGRDSKKRDGDLIPLESNRPGMNGLQVVKEIRSFDEKIPVVVLTIDNHHQVADLFFKGGTSDYAVKGLMIRTAHYDAVR